MFVLSILERLVKSIGKKKTAEVKSEGMRPEIEDNTSPDIVKLFEACWHTFVE